MQLMMPINPPSCGFAALLSALSKGSKGKGKSSGNMGSIMGAPTRPSRVAVQKRQLGGLFGKGKNVDLSRASAVFIGGGGSAGSGSAFAAKGSDVKSGVYIGPNDKFTFTAEIVNYDPKEKPIYLSLDYEWVPGKTAGLMDVGMGALNANGCGDLSGLFMPPKDKPITYEGAEWTVTQPGYFVNFTPHLHDGGVNVKIILNGTAVWWGVGVTMTDRIRQGGLRGQGGLRVGRRHSLGRREEVGDDFVVHPLREGDCLQEGRQGQDDGHVRPDEVPTVSFCPRANWWMLTAQAARLDEPRPRRGSDGAGQLHLGQAQLAYTAIVDRSENVFSNPKQSLSRDVEAG
jgi:hypothetical protein